MSNNGGIRQCTSSPRSALTKALAMSFRGLPVYSAPEGGQEADLLCRQRGGVILLFFSPLLLVSQHAWPCLALREIPLRIELVGVYPFGFYSLRTSGRECRDFLPCPFLFGTARTVTYDLNGRQMSVFDYHQERYRVTLRWANLPVISTSKGEHVSMELAWLEPMYGHAASSGEEVCSI